MRFYRLAIISSLLLATSVSATGLQAIYQQAIKADPVWLGALAGNRAAQEVSRQSFAAFLPSANLTASSTSNFQESQSFNTLIPDRREKFNSNAWTLSVTQPVFSMLNYATHRQAKASVRQSNIELTAEAQDLVLRVAQAYFDALSAEAELSAAQAEKKANARQLEQAQKRFEVGLLAITDVHEAQASHDLALANEIAAQNSLLLAGVALSEITGETYDALTGLSSELKLLAPEPENIDDWVQQALRNNLDLSAAKAALEVAQENLKINRAGHFPTLDLVATSGNSTSHGGNFGNDTDTDRLTLQFNLPIYAGGSISSQTRQALAELDQTRHSLMQTKRATEKLARDAYLGVITEISRTHALEQAVVSTQSAVDATEAGFDVGTRTIVDVLNAQRALYSARSDLQQARYSYLINGLRLKQATGSLSGDDIASLEQILKPH